MGLIILYFGVILVMLLLIYDVLVQINKAIHHQE